MRVGVIGLGYVGQTIARAAAASGHVVIGYDVSAESVKKLDAKQLSNFIGTTDETKLSDCEIVFQVLCAQKLRPELLNHQGLSICMHRRQSALTLVMLIGMLKTLRVCSPV